MAQARLDHFVRVGWHHLTILTELGPSIYIYIYIKDTTSACVPCPEQDFVRNGNSAPIGRPSSRNSLDVQFTSDRIHFMAKSLIQSVVKQLQKERARLENELHGVTAALTTFGKVFLHGGKGSRRGGRKIPRGHNLTPAPLASRIPSSASTKTREMATAIPL